MPEKSKKIVEHRQVELEGIEYVIVRKTFFDALCQQAGMDEQPPSSNDGLSVNSLGIDQESLSKKIRRRRRAAGLTQTGLARRAGIRPETVNRIERGRTTPDFATIRKLVEAMNAAEVEQTADSIHQQTKQESSNVAEYKNA